VFQRTTGCRLRNRHHRGLRDCPACPGCCRCIGSRRRRFHRRRSVRQGTGGRNAVADAVIDRQTGHSPAGLPRQRRRLTRDNSCRTHRETQCHWGDGDSSRRRRRQVPGSHRSQRVLRCSRRRDRCAAGEWQRSRFTTIQWIWRDAYRHCVCRRPRQRAQPA